MAPLIREKLLTQRSVFSAGHRIKINIVPIFINIFAPWATFAFVYEMCCSYARYVHPVFTWGAVGVVFVLWACLAVAAVYARLQLDDATWFTYLAVAVLAAAIAGIVTGSKNYHEYELPYLQIKDLRTVTGIDPALTPGANVIDGGIFEFSAGTRFDHEKSWHFKHGTLFCVAPIISNTSEVPLRQTYDFWAVGKDCCSLSASDFRCDSWGSATAKSAYRVMNAGEIPMYHLAVQQAEALYDIMAPNPIFVHWATDPHAVVNSWDHMMFKNAMLTAAFMFVVSIFGVTMATARFAWLGRGSSAYQVQYLDNPDYDSAGTGKAVDYGKMYTA